MRILSIVFALIAFPVLADEKAKPNTLTPREITDGWVLLLDGDTTFGWKVEGEVGVKDGKLVLGGSKAATASLTTTWGKFSIDLEYSANGTTWNHMSVTREGPGKGKICAGAAPEGG